MAAIIYDEIYHRDYFDDAQDYKSPLQINQNVLIEKFVEVIYEIKYEGNDNERTTLGIGQISVEGFKKLRRLGYLDSQDIPGWDQDYFAASVKYLLDPTTAPLAVAANLQYLIDIISSDSGVNVANNLEIVAHYYNAGYYVGSGTTDENLSNGIEKIERMPRMEDILNLN